MTPLEWPDFVQQPAPASWFKRHFTCWNNYWNNLHQATAHLNRQLLARPRPDPLVWGEDPLRIKMGLLVCKRIQTNYAWPNDHFLPEDPFKTITLLPWDDLDIVELVMALEEELDIVIVDAEAMSWDELTLGNVVDRLLAIANSTDIGSSGRRR